MSPLYTPITVSIPTVTLSCGDVLPDFAKYFPISYSKAHKNCGQMSEIEAKVRYVKLARSLKTYGVSFFLVKVGYTFSLP